MCGMGRTGTMFAIEQERVCPDIVTMAKGLGAGYLPIGATMASERVVGVLKAGSGALGNGHTYMSHAVACAGSLAVLECIEREGLLENVCTQGARLRAALERRFGAHPHVGDIRGRGLFLALELVEDRASRQPFARSRKLAESIRASAMQQGLVCYPSSGGADGERGDHVLLAPPFILADDQVDEIVDKLEATLRIVLEEAA
jgi:hypothetical protein